MSGKKRRSSAIRDVHSKTVAVVSDLHFEESTDWPAWRAFREWHADVRPHITVILGDFIDAGQLSRWPQGPNAPPFVIPEIKCFVREANALAAECGTLYVCEGNHDGMRWDATVFGPKPHALQGAIGLDLKSQCYAQGLEARVRWHRETNRTPDLKIGQFALTHGHLSSGPFGGPKHLAANMLSNSYGEDQVQGHNHRAQLGAVTTPSGRVAVAIANACFQTPQNYRTRPNWQTGFTVLELQAPDYKRATGYPVIIENGRFALAGKTYDGNESAS